MNSECELFVGWDIGGAHLKIAYLSKTGQIQYLEQFYTPIWQGIEILEEMINVIVKDINQRFPDYTILHAVTMTAELSDVFSCRHQGVIKICEMLNKKLVNQVINFYSGKKGFVNKDQVESMTDSIASANWCATASLVAIKNKKGVLVDFGSTTTDIIPFVNGSPINQGYSDHERLSTQELLYTGIIRTPVIAITNTISFKGKSYNMMAENFATMADVYRITGDLNEQDDSVCAADAGDKTMDASRKRLARMIGLDELFNNDDQMAILELANKLSDIQLNMIKSAIDYVISTHSIEGNAILVGAGCGQKLLKKLASSCLLDFKSFDDLYYSTKQTHSPSTCAAAVSVADLLRIEHGH